MKSDLELRHLRVFVGVVEAGGHTRAARALGLSQSTVSETLSALERTLGTALFHKASKGAKSMHLSPSGAALLPHARRMLAASDELLGELARLSPGVQSVVGVAAVESLSAYVLPAHFAHLRQRWPAARFEVTTGVCVDIRDAVAAGRSDLGLVLEADAGAVADDSILARARLVLLVSPTHRLAGRQASPGDLAGAEVAMSDAAGNFHQLLRQYFEAAGMSPPRTETLGSVEGVKRGVLASSKAFGLLPAHAVEAELREGRLSEVALRPALPGLVLRSVLPRAGPGSPIVGDLLQCLRADARDSAMLGHRRDDNGSPKP